MNNKPGIVNIIVAIAITAIITATLTWVATSQNSDDTTVNVNTTETTATEDNAYVENTNEATTPIITEKNCVSDDCLAVDGFDYPAGDLPDEVVNALEEAIADEYKARTVYEAVMDSFGQVRPFSMIIRAEESHIASLKALFDKYGIAIPDNTLPISDIEVPATIQESCQVGVDAEIANAALYEEQLLPAVADYEDITTVFTSLMNASQDKHLSAFDKCN